MILYKDKMQIKCVICKCERVCVCAWVIWNTDMVLFAWEQMPNIYILTVCISSPRDKIELIIGVYGVAEYKIACFFCLIEKIKQMEHVNTIQITRKTVTVFLVDWNNTTNQKQVK